MSEKYVKETLLLIAGKKLTVFDEMKQKAFWENVLNKPRLVITSFKDWIIKFGVLNLVGLVSVITLLSVNEVVVLQTNVYMLSLRSLIFFIFY